VIDLGKVAPARSALKVVPYKAAVESLLTKPPSLFPGQLHHPTGQPSKPVEACSRYHGQLVAGVHFHPVVAAIHLAFNDHRPLVLSPDMLWLLVAQGFANHVNANAEELRPRLVKHSGKVVLDVRRDDFIKGSPENPWPDVFDEFTGRIREHIGEATHDLLLPAFSTTGVAERAAAQVVLLDAMQSYFSYEFHTLCGIPRIVLEGAADDWVMLAERARGLGRFGLEWWTGTLTPILDEFVAAARGQVNARFWQSIYKLDGGSGGPYTTGWITAFFPYLKDWRTGLATNKNPWLVRGGQELQELLFPPEKADPYRFGHGPTTEAFPSGLTKAPFLWNYLGQSFDMEFLGGFVGIRQDAETLCLRPEIGWALRDLALIRSLEGAEAAAAADQRAAAEKARAEWQAKEAERKAAVPPCPYCGARLRTDKAKQCFECGTDWHDPHNVVSRKHA
jgi:hypothetical protein